MNKLSYFREYLKRLCASWNKIGHPIFDQVIRFLKPVYEKQLSKLVIVVVVVSALILGLHFERWNDDNGIITADVYSYYAYLTATFVQHDISMSFIKGNADKYSDRFWPFESPIGKYTIVTSMGMSVLYAPFFFVAHALASPLGYVPDGYSPIYKFAIFIASVFYFLWGLIFLRKVLRKYFSELITAISLFAITIGTNLLYYVSIESGMSHAYNFSLICIFIYLVIRWYASPNFWNTLGVGALAGLITLIRPTNILVLIILILWGVISFKTFWERILYFIHHFYWVLLMMAAFFVVWVPQFLYWKYTTGVYLFYSYGHFGGVFFFDNPQFLLSLFSYRKGWLLYTPIMIFALTGLVFLYKKYKFLFVPAVLFTLVNIYLISCWWCWWFGGGFGQRSYIDSYAVLVFGLAAFLAAIVKQKNWIRIPLLLLMALIIWFNTYQTRQYLHGAIHYVSMTNASYWETFLKMHPTQDFYELLRYPNYPEAKKGNYPVEHLDRWAIKDSLKKARASTQHYEDLIRNNKGLMEMVRDKAERRNLTVDEMIQIDAQWLYDRIQQSKDTSETN